MDRFFLTPTNDNKFTFCSRFARSTALDVGTSKSTLESLYSPFVDFGLVTEEEWWWNEDQLEETYVEWRPSGENQQYSVKGEVRRDETY